MNVVLILGILSACSARPSPCRVLRGSCLTIGAAVDANVLIFERLREEQHLRDEPPKIAMRQRV